MAVIEYKSDEHPGGFIGFRVARTVGNSSNYKQKYFSIKKHGYHTAKRLAYKLNDKLSSLACEELKNKKMTTIRNHSSANVVTPGLRAYISTESKKRNDKTTVYFIPCFLVKKVGAGQSSISYRIAKHGYRNAYILAVKKYVEIHDLTAGQHLSLLSMMPDKTIFTDHLLNNVYERGHQLSKKMLTDILDNPNSLRVAQAICS